MKKTLIALSLIMAIAIPMAVFAAGLVVDVPADMAPKGKKEKSAVTFNHEQHSKTIACLECHHKSDEAKLKAGEKPAKCFGGDCHIGTEKVVDGKKMVDTKKAYHANCLDGCHKKDKKGPTKCDECHPK
jgi:hypothetical protein